MADYDRGRNKGKVAPKVTNRKASITISVSIDPRRLAEAVTYLERNGITVQSKSDIGAKCIEAIAMHAVSQGEVPSCDALDTAFNFLEKKGFTWTRERDKRRIANLLTMESADRTGYGSGFDPSGSDSSLKEGEQEELMRKAREYALELKRQQEAPPTPSTNASPGTRLEKDSTYREKEREELERIKQQLRERG